MICVLCDLRQSKQSRQSNDFLRSTDVYLRAHSPYLDSSFPRSESQNTIGVNLLGNHSTSCYIVDFLFTYTPSPLASLP